VGQLGQSREQCVAGYPLLLPNPTCCPLLSVPISPVWVEKARERP
jgi:hypothetical protein